MFAVVWSWQACVCPNGAALAPDAPAARLRLSRGEYLFPHLWFHELVDLLQWDYPLCYLTRTSSCQINTWQLIPLLHQVCRFYTDLFLDCPLKKNPVNIFHLQVRPDWNAVYTNFQAHGPGQIFSLRFLISCVSVFFDEYWICCLKAWINEIRFWMDLTDKRLILNWDFPSIRYNLKVAGAM